LTEICDLVIKNGYCISFDSKLRLVTKRTSIYISNNKISHIGELKGEYRASKADVKIEASGKIVIPGLVNLHMHSGPVAIRGLAEGLPLFPWLQTYVDPAHRVLTEKDAYADYMLSYVEMVKSGITSVLDMYRFGYRGVEAAEKVGIRTTIAPYVSDLPEYSFLEKPSDNYRLLKEKNGSANGRVRIWIGLEHIVYCSEEAFVKAREYADKYKVGIHTHGEESKQMRKQIKIKYGLYPIQLFGRYGILKRGTVLAHCVWLNETEMNLLSKTNTSVAHCPTSNMKLASGIAPIIELLDKGVNVGLGTDGVKENNRLDMFQEMKISSLLQKVRHLNASIMTPEQVFFMATLGGARALMLERETGTIEIGKKADLVIVDYRRPHLTPVIERNRGNILANLVFSAQPSDVNTVIVDGSVIVRNSKVMTVNEQEIISLANKRAMELLERVDFRDVSSKKTECHGFS